MSPKPTFLASSPVSPLCILHYFHCIYYSPCHPPLCPCSYQNYEVCPEAIQPYNMKNRDIYWRRYKKHCTYDNDTSVPFKVVTLGPHAVLPIAISCPIIFSESHQQSEISFLSKVIWVLGKARSRRAPNLSCWRVIWCLAKNSAQDVMHEQAHYYDEAANHQLPIAVAFWIIWISSVEECSSFMQNLMYIHCSIHSVISNAMATQYTCSLNDVYSPHWLVKSSLFTHEHSSPLFLTARLHLCHANHSHYINNGWTFSRQTS